MPRRHLHLLSSLRARFFVALLVLGVVPLGLTGLGVAALDRATYTAQSVRELVGLARGAAGALEVYVSEALNDSGAIAALPDIESMEPSRQDRVLKELFHHYPLFARISVFSLSGERTASSHADGAASIAERASFQTALRGRQAWEVANALSTGRSSLLVHTPIRDAERRVVGVLGVVVDMESLSAVFARGPLGSDERAFVLDATGRVILHPDPTTMQAGLDYAWLGVPSGGRPAGPGTVRYELDGAARCAAYAPVPGTGWTVLVERPESSVLAPLERSWNLAVAGVAASALLAMVGAYALAGTLTRPVRALATAARALEAGDSSAPLPRVETHDGDLAALVGAFSAMRQAVATREQALMVEVTKHQRAEAALEYQAGHDALTGLPNRLLLQDRLEQALLAGRRDGTPAALLLMDLDGFKEVNDTLGHFVGDLLLREIADRLRDKLDAVHTVARLGGDEFAIVLRGAGAEVARAVATDLLDALRQPFLLEGCQLEVGAGIGIALYPEHGDDVQTLLRRADVAMYVAKRAGGGHSLYSAEQDDHSPERLALVAELRRAIEQDELRLHYQPLVDARSAQLIGVEALVRWEHPQHGLVPPDRFIPLAERTGLIIGLTRWVLNAALAQTADWRGLGMAVPVSANLSMRNVLDPDLPAQVAGLLERWRVPPDQLKLEITESVVMADPERATAALAQLREVGVGISIDDFGTGYSSLDRLKRLPVDELKIDRSFVKNMPTDPSDFAIVRSVVQLGHSLGVRVVAEGAEDRLTWEVLAGLGCDAVQGYYVSRPLPPAELLRWFASASPSLRSNARAARSRFEAWEEAVGAIAKSSAGTGQTADVR